MLILADDKNKIKKYSSVKKRLGSTKFYFTLLSRDSYYSSTHEDVILDTHEYVLV